MIFYHPASDAYHGALRQYALLRSFNYPVEIEKIQILDFYLVYPEHLKHVRLPKGYVKWKNHSREISVTYKNKQDPKFLFLAHAKGSKVSTAMLLAKKIVDNNLYEAGLLSLSGVENEILEKVKGRFVSRFDGYFDFLIKLANEVPLYGKDGLKHRTGLLEYRHDVL